jgi:antibiotic biosynthesis monooxygenase (ABM) superfamily enzyme
MEPAAPNPARPPLEVYASRASSVISQVIPAGATDAFLEWQRGISAAAAEAPGYQMTEIYPPAAAGEPWVVIIHFNDPKTLKDWLDSPKRAEWVAKLPCEIRNFRLQTLPIGFGAWFAGTHEETPVQLPPGWKMALTILFTLYPTVMLLSIFIGPYINPLGLTVSILIGNVLSVSILQWLVQPALNPVLGPWLRANEPSQRAYSLGGLAVLLLLLVGMALMFHRVAG